MMNPQTATEKEIDAWLYRNCIPEDHLSYRYWRSGECGPTSDYDQLVMCETKMKDRWWITVEMYPDHREVYATATQMGGGSHYKRVFADSELSARARLVVAILLWEREHDG